MPSLSAQFLVLLVTCVLCGCGTQKLRSHCLGGDGTQCPPCTTDAECVIGSNPCQDFAYCSHAEAPVLVSMEGCSGIAEKEQPSAESCRCIASTCQEPK